jgi:sugar lactone lactonase YvrE
VRLPVVAAAVGVAALLVAGCGDDGGSEDPVARGPITQVEAVTRGGDFRSAIDATVAPDGGTVYFTATSSRGPGVFGVPAEGGVAEAVAVGPPFGQPVGVAVTTDGDRLLVADAGAQASGPPGGAVLSVPVTGGVPTSVRGTEGMSPRGLEVVSEGDKDVAYFTGRDRSDGAAAVFKVAADGADPPTLVAKGSPLSDPDAVTVTRNGVVYVTDRGGPGGEGALYRVSSGSAERIAGIRAPPFAGVTLTFDESTVLVSTLSPQGTDQVLLVDATTLRTDTFSRVIGENREGGGLHRAHRVDVFAWADLAAGPDRQSRVYVLRP